MSNVSLKKQKAKTFLKKITLLYDLCVTEEFTKEKKKLEEMKTKKSKPRRCSKNSTKIHITSGAYKKQKYLK